VQRPPSGEQRLERVTLAAGCDERELPMRALRGSGKSVLDSLAVRTPPVDLLHLVDHDRRRPRPQLRVGLQDRQHAIEREVGGARERVVDDGDELRGLSRDAEGLRGGRDGLKRSENRLPRLAEGDLDLTYISE